MARRRRGSYVGVELTKKDYQALVKVVPGLEKVEFRFSEEVSVSALALGVKGLGGAG